MSAPLCYFCFASSGRSGVREGTHIHTGCWLGRTNLRCHISFSRIPYLKKEAQYVVGDAGSPAQRSSSCRFSLGKSCLSSRFVETSIQLLCGFICEYLGQAFSYVDIVSHCHFLSFHHHSRFNSVIIDVPVVNKTLFPPVHTPTSLQRV